MQTQLLRRLEQEGCKFKASLGNSERPRLRFEKSWRYSSVEEYLLSSIPGAGGKYSNYGSWRISTVSTDTFVHKRALDNIVKCTLFYQNSRRERIFPLHGYHIKLKNKRPNCASPKHGWFDPWTLITQDYSRTAAVYTRSSGQHSEIWRSTVTSIKVLQKIIHIISKETKLLRENTPKSELKT